MKLKKAFLSIFAAGAIFAGGMGGAVASNSDSAQGQAQVNTGGTFNVYICHSNASSNELINFGTANLTSQNPTAKLNSQLVICYTDTQPNRGAFKTNLSSSHFFHTTMGWNTISNSNLKPTKVYNPGQGQWGVVNGVQIGNIGARDGQGNAVTSGSATWGNSSTFANGPLYVGYGNPGAGTGSTWYQTQFMPGTTTPYSPDARSTNGAWAPIDMELTVPNTTVSGMYKNTFTVDVTFNAPN